MWDNIYAPEVAEHFFQLPEHIIEAEMDIERVASFEQAGKEVVTEIKKVIAFQGKVHTPQPISHPDTELSETAGGIAELDECIESHDIPCSAVRHLHGLDTVLPATENGIDVY